MNNDPTDRGPKPITVRVREACRLTGIGRSKLFPSPPAIFVRSSLFRSCIALPGGTVLYWKDTDEAQSNRNEANRLLADPRPRLETGGFVKITYRRIALVTGRFNVNNCFIRGCGGASSRGFNLPNLISDHGLH